MRIANRHFKPTLAGTIATLMLLPILISLGFWQLRRADEKRALVSEFQIGAATTQRLTSDSIAHIPLLQHVIAQGSYDATRQVLLDNIPANAEPQKGQPGYHVLTPFKLADGSVLLVNRGWLPVGRTRNELPKLDVPTQDRSIRGRVSDLPRAGVRMGAVSNSSLWPRVLNFPVFAELRQLYGDKLLDKTILLDPAESDGYQRDWTARYTFGEFGPDRHIAYAVQWFALAFALCIIYLVANLKRLPE